MEFVDKQLPMTDLYTTTQMTSSHAYEDHSYALPLPAEAS